MLPAVGYKALRLHDLFQLHNLLRLNDLFQLHNLSSDKICMFGYIAYSGAKRLKTSLLSYLKCFFFNIC